MARRTLRFAMIGTRGVPAQYGGFETAVEEVGARLVERGHDVVVYCRNEGQQQREHRGMRLVNLPALRKRSLETLSHTGLSVAHSAIRRPDAMIVFNAANAPYIPLIRALRIPAAVHMDGLEWKRAKWEGAGASYYKRAEAAVANSGSPMISDARGIADYLRETYGRDSHFIPYGAPSIEPGDSLLAQHGLERGRYHLVVARMEPENHVSEILEGYRETDSPHPLVVVGSAPYESDYTRRVALLGNHPAIRMLGSVWDQSLLDQLYANSRSYLHGHSVGGTNPSLLRALGCGAPVTAYDVNFNREVTAGHARFFHDPTSVATALEADDADPEGAAERGRAGKEHATLAYRWDQVADGYEDLLTGLATGRIKRAD